MNVDSSETAEQQADGADVDSGGIKVETSSGTKVLREGSLEFEMSFWEEMDGTAGTDIDFYVRDEEQEVLHHRSLFSEKFNSATGHYDLTFSLTDQETGKETTTQVESRFTDVVPGENFVWDIDRITFEQNGNSTEMLRGQIRVQARPEDLVQPEDPVMLFDLSEEEMRKVGGTISQNLIRLFGTEAEEEATEERMSELTDAKPEAGETEEETEEETKKEMTDTESEAKIVIFQ